MHSISGREETRILLSRSDRCNTPSSMSSPTTAGSTWNGPETAKNPARIAEAVAWWCMTRRLNAMCESERKTQHHASRRTRGPAAETGAWKENLGRHRVFRPFSGVSAMPCSIRSTCPRCMGPLRITAAVSSIKRLNPKLNAYVTSDLDSARKEAEMKHKIVGRRGADGLLFRVAPAIEALVPWSDRRPTEE